MLYTCYICICIGHMLLLAMPPGTYMLCYVYIDIYVCMFFSCSQNPYEFIFISVLYFIVCGFIVESSI